MLSALSTILVSTSNFTLSELTLRWQAAVQNMSANTLVPRVLSVNLEKTLGRDLPVKVTVFRRAYDVVQQTIESLDNPASTSFQIDGISLRLDYLTRTLVRNCKG